MEFMTLELHGRPVEIANTPMASKYTLHAKSTLNTLRSRGGGPEWFRLANKCYYTRQALDSWLSSQIQYSQSAAAPTGGDA